LAILRQLAKGYGSVYSLVVARNGPRLKEHSGEGSPGISASTGSGQTAITGTKVTMAGLAEYLNGQADRPVIDNTGLRGECDFRVVWATDDATGSPGPTLFTADREQLGLTLDATKGPIEIIVIDGVERPLAN
jgi:uncharacterized protein (TIGR03435 family)